MRNYLKYTPSPALVVATAALVMACGGTAIAASGGPGNTDTNVPPGGGSPTVKPDYVYKESPTIKVPDSQFDVAIVKCPTGMYPISGGFVMPNSGDMVVKHSRPTNLNRWPTSHA